jgi:hypothetical protein
VKEGKQMKKRLIFLTILAMVLTGILSGCKKKAPAQESDPTQANKGIVEVDEDEKEKIIKEFDNIVEKHEDLEDIVAYVNQNIGKVDELNANDMIDTLEKTLGINLDDVFDRILATDKKNELMEIAGTQINFPEDKIGEIKNKKLKTEITKIYNSKLKLVNLEGAFYPIIDYAKFSEYNGFVSEEWRDYLSLKAFDSDDIPFVDGSIRIPFDSLADRILKTENFLNKFIDGPRQEEILDQYEQKLSAYMKGLDNTAIYDGNNTKLIFDDVMDSYDKLSKVDGYITPTIVYKYIEVIKENKGVIDENVFKEADKFIAEAVEMLKEFK